MEQEGIGAGGAEAVECSICYEDMLSSEPSCTQAPCSHHFHGECLSKWTFAEHNMFAEHNKNSCPACRAPIPRVVRTKQADDFEMVCEHGHALDGFETPHAGFVCDVCEQDLPPHAQTYRCRTCDFDICNSCQAARNAHEAEARGGGGGAGGEAGGEATSDKLWKFVTEEENEQINRDTAFRSMLQRMRMPRAERLQMEVPTSDEELRRALLRMYARFNGIDVAALERATAVAEAAGAAAVAGGGYASVSDGPDEGGGGDVVAALGGEGSSRAERRPTGSGRGGGGESRAQADDE